MATVCREVFGKRPSFLKIKSKRSLVDLIRNSALASTGETAENPFHVIGRRVVPTSWLTLKKEPYTYYTITRVEWNSDYKQAQVYGHLTQNGNQLKKEIPIKDYSGYHWMFHSNLVQEKELAVKLGMSPSLSS